MQSKPETQHLWLKKFVGEWSYEGEADMGGQVVKNAGTESVRAIGDLWVIGEGRWTMPDGGPATSLITLGYDPQKGKFVGTWVGSMMPSLWVYDAGSLDAAGRTLTLECDGPSFDDEERAAGTMSRYRDVFEFRSDDHRVLTASVRGNDGAWTTFMTTHYRRK